MALPKTIRLLAAITIVVLLYLIAQVYRAPAELHVPDRTPPSVGSGTGKLQQWDHDPQADREALQLALPSIQID
jgi:mannosyltransferase